MALLKSSAASNTRLDEEDNYTPSYRPARSVDIPASQPDPTEDIRRNDPGPSDDIPVSMLFVLFSFLTLIKHLCTWLRLLCAGPGGVPSSRTDAWEAYRGSNKQP